MSTELDLELGPEVVALLDEFGRDVSFDVVSKTYDPTSGETTYGSEPPVVAKTTPPWPYGTAFGKGTAAVEGKATIIVAGLDIAFVPKLGIQATIDGLKWRVVGLTPISSGADNAAYLMDVER